MKRFTSVVAVGFVTVSASIGAVFASGSTVTDQPVPVAARVVESAEVAGNVQPGIEVRRLVAPTVTAEARSAQPGVPQPQPQPEARSVVTTAPAGNLVTNVQPGVEIRGFETQPSVEAQAFSAQPGATILPPAARSVGTTGSGLAGNAQPGVEIREAPVGPSAQVQALSVQSGATLSSPRHSQTNETDWTSLAYAAAYDRCAADSLAELVGGGQS